MKKLLWFGCVMTLSIIMVLGCSSKEETIKDTATETSNDKKSELLDFYLSIANTINSVDSDLNTYEAAENPTILTEEDKKKAADSANDVVTELNDVKIPASLQTYNKEFKEAITKIAESYQEKGVQLSGTGEINMDKANELFNDGNEKINGIFNSEGLSAPNLSTEVND